MAKSENRRYLKLNNQEKSSLSQTASTAQTIHGAIKTGKAISAAAKDQYIQQYGRRLYGLCRSLCASPYDADDLYQETWLASTAQTIHGAIKTGKAISAAAKGAAVGGPYGAAAGAAIYAAQHGKKCPRYLPWPHSIGR